MPCVLVVPPEQLEQEKASQIHVGWDPLGPDGKKIRQRIAKKHEHALDALMHSDKHDDKLRAFSLAGNIIKKPPRIGEIRRDHEQRCCCEKWKFLLI